MLVSVALVVLVTDIITKAVVVATLEGRAPVRLLGGLLQLRVTRNPGAAFSIGGPSMTVLFALIALGVIVFILRTSRRIQSLAWTITLGLLLGGATGNLTDRVFRWPGPFRGWVVDWIQLPHWPVFNVADSCIVCGGVLAVFLAVRGVRIDGTVIPPRGAVPASEEATTESEPEPGTESSAEYSAKASAQRPDADRPADGEPASDRPGEGEPDSSQPGDSGLSGQPGDEA